MKTAGTTIFFGTSQFSVFALETMKRQGYVPDLIVTNPDKPQGRKLVMTAPTTKIWAEAEKVPVLQFDILDEQAVEALKALSPKLFIVASYGKIIPQAVLELPEHGCLNIHPSLLPQYRGASPLQSAILNDTKDTGVTIIKMDAKMDHGPIVAQEKVNVEPWPARFPSLERLLAEEGALLLLKALPKYMNGELIPVEQEHDKATFTKKIKKDDGLLEIHADQPEAIQYQNFLKIRAFEGWPGTYFFTKRKGKPIRVVITDADFADSKLILKKVIPEGKKEMEYTEFLKGL